MRGVIYPVISIGLEKCLVFGLYDNIKKINCFGNALPNYIFAGLFSGFMCTAVITSVEKIKILQDTKIILSLSQLYKELLSTSIKKIPGYGIYFITYDVLKASGALQDSYFRIPLFGAVSGILASMIITLSDPIKTTMQPKIEKIHVHSIYQRIHYCNGSRKMSCNYMDI